MRPRFFSKKTVKKGAVPIFSKIHGRKTGCCFAMVCAPWASEIP